MSSPSLEVFKQKLYDHQLKILWKGFGHHMNGWTRSVLSNPFHIIENSVFMAHCR